MVFCSSCKKSVVLQSQIERIVMQFYLLLLKKHSTFNFLQILKTGSNTRVLWELSDKLDVIISCVWWSSMVFTLMLQNQHLFLFLLFLYFYPVELLLHFCFY